MSGLDLLKPQDWEQSQSLICSCWHAIEDFPDKKSYMAMEFAPLEDDRDRFGQWIFVILAARNLNNFEQIADSLCVSQVPEIICAYEMEVWKDIGIVLTDRGELDRLYALGLQKR